MMKKFDFMIDILLTMKYHKSKIFDAQNKILFSSNEIILGRNKIDAPAILTLLLPPCVVRE